MCDMQDAITVAVKACTLCSGGLLESDKFCRWCGARQFEPASSNQTASRDSTGLASTGSSAFTTSALKRSAEAGLYRRISGPLVSAVVSGVSAGSVDEPRGRLTKRAILALI